MTDASVTDAQVESTLPPLTLSLPSTTSGQPDVTIKASALDTYLQRPAVGSTVSRCRTADQDPSTFGDAFLQAFVTISTSRGAASASPRRAARRRRSAGPSPREEGPASRPAPRPALSPRVRPRKLIARGYRRQMPAIRRPIGRCSRRPRRSPPDHPESTPGAGYRARCTRFHSLPTAEEERTGRTGSR